MIKTYWIEKWDGLYRVWRKAKYWQPYWGGVASLEEARNAVKHLQNIDPKRVYRIIEYHILEPVEQWREQ